MDWVLRQSEGKHKWTAEEDPGRRGHSDDHLRRLLRSRRNMGTRRHDRVCTEQRPWNDVDARVIERRRTAGVYEAQSRRPPSAMAAAVTIGPRVDLHEQCPQ